MTGERANILVVDDRMQNLVALEEVLRPLEQNVVTVSSGDEALKRLLKEDFAVILLDVQMPILDGFQTAAYIKQLEKTRHIPIIFLTAINKDHSHVFRGYSAGGVDYVVKPIDPVVLRSKVAVFLDLHEKKLALQVSEERFRRAFEDAPIGIALVGLNGDLLDMNRSLCDLLAVAEGELKGRRLESVVHPDDTAHVSKVQSEMLEGVTQAAHFEVRLRCPDGREIDTLTSMSLIHPGRGLDPYFIAQIDDITERKQLESFREAFIANAAHELRTPLTAVVGFAEILAHGWADMKEEQIERALNALDRQGKRLSGLVNNLLDLTRLTEGRIEVNLQSVDLASAAERVLEMTPPPQGKTVETKVGAEIRVIADPMRLEQILTNLLVNAYRYGGTRVNVSARRNNGRVEVEVSDNGAGVPADLVPRLFEPFTRGASASDSVGSGLGLALVRSMAEACGGDVQYEPAEPGGARFLVRLGGPA
jgi:PAS domain S-box-containing protein